MTTDRRLIIVLLLWLAFIVAANFANAQLTPGQAPLSPPPGPGLTPAIQYSRVATGEFMAHTLEWSLDGHNWYPLGTRNIYPRYWMRELVGEFPVRLWEVVQP